MATVWIPSPFTSLTHGEKIIRANGATVKDLVEALDHAYPGLKDAIIEDGIVLKRGIAVVVDGNVVQKGLLHPVTCDSEVHFIPAIGGG